MSRRLPERHLVAPPVDPPQRRRERPGPVAQTQQALSPCSATHRSGKRCESVAPTLTLSAWSASSALALALSPRTTFVGVAEAFANASAAGATIRATGAVTKAARRAMTVRRISRGSEGRARSASPFWVMPRPESRSSSFLHAIRGSVVRFPASAAPPPQHSPGASTLVEEARPRRIGQASGRAGVR